MNNEFLPPRGFRHNDYPHHGPRKSLAERSKHLQPHPDAFKTPDIVAAQEEQHPETNTAGAIIGHHQKPKKTLKERLKSITKKQWIIIGIVAAVLLGGGFAAYYFLIRDDPKPVVVKKEEKKKPAPAPVPLYSTLTGLPIADTSVNDRPVTAIMIENSQDARPQSGLNQAGVVFEAIAEGGITRFLTLFQDSEPDYIGPVRSVRPYYVQWLMGFDAAVAHVGGSGQALAMIKSEGVKDLDQFANSGAYWRVSNRYAPHNMYTSMAKLREAENKRGFGKSNYTGFARKDDAANAQPSAKTIDFNISGALYNAHYDYDIATNSYKRSEGGQPHVDERSAQQLSPKVVIGLAMPQGKNGVYTTYNTIGSGQAFVFQDGVVIPGTWEKTSNTAQFVFKDGTGAEIKLNRGQTWITVVGSPDRVTYQP
jgi:DUF3048 family protein